MSMTVIADREDEEAICCVCDEHFTIDAMDLCESCDQLFCENCGDDDECDDCANGEGDDE